MCDYLTLFSNTSILIFVCLGQTNTERSFSFRLRGNEYRKCRPSVQTMLGLKQMYGAPQFINV